MVLVYLCMHLKTKDTTPGRSHLAHLLDNPVTLPSSSPSAVKSSNNSKFIFCDPVQKGKANFFDGCA